MADYHSKFTPSQSNQETLEALFVAREKLAQKIMEGIRESATSGNKHQRLLVGPRGMGKTHFVALIYHRLQADAELSELLRIAWLKEDPHIAGYPNLLMLILRKLQQEYRLDHLKAQLTTILDMGDIRKQEQALEQLLLECLDGKTLLLITENLDDLLNALKEEGQRKLRAFIQNHSQTTIFATTTSLTDAVTDRNKTFYGFFRTHTLEPFNVQDAAHLLARRAKRDDNIELANTIWSPLGLARIRAIHYLAGGNPRIYALFYDFLNRQSLDDLVEPFMKLMDELTPYYQALMSKLAPLQQQIIDVLRHQRGAITVKEIAREAMASSQTISSQLGKLQELGYVIQAESLGRSNYYELREPLMRLCLDVKEQHGRTVELFVQFLRIWYGKSELDQLTNDSDCKALEVAHLKEVTQRALSEQDPLHSLLEREFQKHRSTGEHQQALEAVEAAIQRTPDDKKNWQHKAWCLRDLDQSLEEQLVCWKRITEIDSNDAHAWNLQSYILYQLGRKEEALEASAIALALKPDNPVFNRNHGINLKETGAPAEANEYLEKALKLEGEPKAATDWLRQGTYLWKMDRQHSALSAYCNALELNPYFIHAWETLMSFLRTQGYLKLLLDIAQRTTTLIPNEAIFWLYLGISQSINGDYKNALTSFEHALALDAELNKATLYRGCTLANLGRYSEALEVFEQPQPETTANIDFQHILICADTLMWLDRWDKGRDKLNQTLQHFQPTTYIYPVTILIARTSNPHIWRRFISLWLELFEQHNCLVQLGEALVRSIRRFSLHWVTEQTARAWLKIWQELAGEIEELALPLRLLKAGVEYKANRDQRALLVLPREERGLLEPWLANLFKEEPDEIDQKMEALFHNIEPKLAEDKKQARIEAFWSTPAPQPKTLDFAKLLADYDTQPTTTARYLLPDHWSRLNHTQAKALLKRLATNSENGIRALSRPALLVTGIDKRPVSFSDLTLYQIHIKEDNRYGALDLLATTDKIHLLDGRSEKLHNLFTENKIHTDTPERQSDYVRLYFSTIRSEEGRFHIIDDLADLHLEQDEELPDNIEIHSWQLESIDNKERKIYSGIVQYSNALFRATLALNPNSNLVEMLGGESIATDLSIETETFDGPIRYVQF